MTYTFSLITLPIYFWLCWVLIALHKLSLVVVSGCYSSSGAQASHCGGFSCFWARALGHADFRTCSTWAQQLQLLGSRTQAQKLCCLWEKARVGCSERTDWNKYTIKGETDHQSRLMHETSARDWCTGKTQRDGMGREAGGGIGMGNTCKSMADSCQCMAKTTTIL